MYLAKVAVQDWLAVLVRVSALAFTILGNFVDAHFVIPTRHGKVVGAVGRRREGQPRDGIRRRVAERDVSLEVAQRARRR